MKNNSPWNNSISLWTSANETYSSYPMGGPVLSVYNGVIGSPMEVLAKCVNQHEALHLMKKAGFKQIKNHPTGRVDFKARPIK